MTETIRIDTSQVPSELLSHPLFLFCLADVKAKLADPNEIRAICIHEAAHLFYMTKAGMRDPEFTGPRILYNSTTGEFDRYAAAVRCPNRDDSQLAALTIAEWFFQLAKAHAAGGVAARVLADRPDMDSGDSEDRENFDKAYSLIWKDPTPTADKFWAEARRILEIELQEERLKEYILQLADTIKPELFKS